MYKTKLSEDVCPVQVANQAVEGLCRCRPLQASEERCTEICDRDDLVLWLGLNFLSATDVVIRGRVRQVVGGALMVVWYGGTTIL